MKIDKKIRKKKPFYGTPSLQFAAPSEGRALRLCALSECATSQLKELGTNSLYNYACWQLRLVTHPSGLAELHELN